MLTPVWLVGRKKDEKRGSREGLMPPSSEPLARTTTTGGSKESVGGRRARKGRLSAEASTLTSEGGGRRRRESSPAPSGKEGAELKEIAQRLTLHVWYHGLMPREEIEDLLRHDGDFLLRKTDVSKKPRITLSVAWCRRIRHILLNHMDGMWYIRQVKKPTVEEVVDEHLRQRIPVQSDGALIVNPVARPDFYILHEHIKVGLRLGGGAYGDVHRGILKKGDDETEVAIKKFKGFMKKKQRTEFVKEARIMRKFNHRNVVKVYGVAPQEEPLMIILELCPGGNLLKRLRRNPDTPVEKLVKFATDACRGLTYLSNRKIIHRDIAARNCLLGKDDDVKISDFGLSVAEKELKLLKLRKMPIKWLAPETLKLGIFTTKSDVWAFGIMLWEIFTLCQEEPYPGDTNAQAKEKIVSGQVMPTPANAPPAFQDAMAKCFTMDLEARPGFENVFCLIAPGEPPPPPDNEELMNEIEKFNKEVGVSTFYPIPKV